MINETVTGNDSIAITGTAWAGQRTVGVKGIGDSVGVQGRGKTWHGVEGISESTIGGSGVYGASSAGGTGVVGESKGWIAVGGFASSDSKGAAVYGEHKGTQAGVWGNNLNDTNNAGPGVVGTSKGNHGVLGITSEHSHAGVRGENTDGGHGMEGVSTGTLAGIYGENNVNGIGVLGVSQNNAAMFASGASGIVAFNFSQNGVAVSGNSQIANGGLAGQFMGNVEVVGRLSKSSGSFKIDHPLDPENKYLYHSFIESPDMMNIYNGNVTTNEYGEATVVLPDYFEALNRDFRYQLTVVGQFARAMVASKIKNNSFIIKTDQPSVEVSWQVTGIRQDAYANANRIQVEEEKPVAERGSFLNAEAYGQSAKRAEEGDLPPEVKELIKKQREQREEKPWTMTNPALTSRAIRS